MEGRDGISPEGMEDWSRSREIEEHGLPVQRTLNRQCFLKQFLLTIKKKNFYFFYYFFDSTKNIKTPEIFPTSFLAR